VSTVDPDQTRPGDPSGGCDDHGLGKSLDHADAEPDQHRRRTWLPLAGLAAVLVSAVALAVPATPPASTPAPTPAPASVPAWVPVPASISASALPSALPSASAPAPAKMVTARRSTENWTGRPGNFHAANSLTALTIVPAADATDGRALKLTLPAYPEPGAAGSAIVASDRLYRYGTFGTRMKTADCTGQDHPGIITGTFTYSMDHSDTNHNQVTDNDEIDIEFLCAQPDVVYLSIWTDYSETSNNLAEISRAINLRTGTVVSTCYILSYGTGCQPLLAGENTPAAVTPVPGFDSGARFRTYAFDWQADHVTFTTCDGSGRQIVLWNYRGPASRIPDRPQALMQNVTYTKAWDPLDGPSHNQPTAPISAYLDSTFMPR